MPPTERTPTNLTLLRENSMQGVRERGMAVRSRSRVRVSIVVLMAAFTSIVAWLVAFAVFPPTVSAQRTGELPKELDGAGVDEKLGETLPADIIFRDEEGRSVELGRYFDGERPVLLNLVYHDCPMLCSLVIQGLTKALAPMDWVPGGEFDVLTISFNPSEGPELAADAKAHALHMLGKPNATGGWHFLTGSQESIDRLTNAVGFRYRWVEDQQEFAHPSVLMFVSGERLLTRYLYGIEYDPRDIRTALVEASNGSIGTTVDRVILYCFQYDADKNSYVPHALNLMKLGGLLTMIALGSMLFVFWRRETRRSSDVAAA